MKAYARNRADMRLQMWGEFIAKSIDIGWPSKNAIADLMEYHIRVASGKTDILPVFEIDQYNMATNRFLLEMRDVDPDVYHMAYYTYAWHYEHSPGELESRRKLRIHAILKKMDVKRRKYQELKNNLMFAMLGKFGGFL